MSSCLLLLSLAVAPDRWERFPPIPNQEGVAGPFAGVSGGSLLVAGGANFPDKKPWDGGTKVWHDAVYRLDRPGGTWRAVGKLPRPLAYGVSVTHGGGVVCVGGSDSDRHHRDCFRLEWDGKSLAIRPLQPLPRPVANACGALLGDTLIVAGGLRSPDATNTLRTVYTLDLSASDSRWKEVQGWPGTGRMLAVAAVCDGSFYLIGGTDLKPGSDGKSERVYLRDAYRFDPTKGWTRLADLPHPVVAAPSPTPHDEAGFYVLGGDDGSRVGFAPIEKHPGFNTTVLRYDAKTDTWKRAGIWDQPRVTVPAVWWNERWVIPSGEARPGVRSPDVWAFDP